MSETEHLMADATGIARAAWILRAGETVGFATETVYGLGGDARNGQAIARIFAAKDRPRFNPLIVHVPDLDAAQALGRFEAPALALARAFWPGPLTMVVPVRETAGLSELVTAGLPSVGLRVPASPAAQALLRAFDGPIAAPSANPSGRISATTAAHVLDGLDGRIAAVLDGGSCDVGLESTIVDCTGPITLLRPGGLSPEHLEQALGHALATAAPTSTPTAPGQLASHYAPRKPVRMNVRRPAPGDLYLGFGAGAADMNLSPTGDLTEAAANLFGALHALDRKAGQAIAVAPIPDQGLGLAINDRLRRAAAPRPT